jgi:hypothetical protein
MIAVLIWLAVGMEYRFSRWEKMEGSYRFGNSTLVPKSFISSGEPPYSILTVSIKILQIISKTLPSLLPTQSLQESRGDLQLVLLFTG